MSSPSESVSEKSVAPTDITAKEEGVGDSDLEPEVPEGGLRAWSVVLGVWLVQFCTFGYTNAFGVYNDFYVREYLAQTATSSQISWIGSVQLMITLSAGLFTGRCFDIGYFWHMMLGGSILFVFCLFMLSLTQPEHYYQVFLAQGLGMGLAIGTTYIPGLGIISHWFRKRRAIALGVATTGSAVGGTLHPIMLNALFHGPVGFHNGVRASAGLNLGLLIIALLLMKSRLPWQSSKGRRTFGEMKAYFKDVPYVVTILGTVMTLTGLYFPIFFLQLNAVKNGINQNLAFYTLAILNAGSTVGRVIPNFFVRRYGVFNVMVPCVAACAILIFCTLAVKTAVSTVVFAILYGFFSGGYVGLLAPMVGSLARSDTEIGERLGMCFTFTGESFYYCSCSKRSLTTHF
ncbi:MFS general substrate transporter [Pluteus cervinus]|uniref:MFS general substrate transporter n=1 Tax=Pluteus cervinus TaxID=181527 RepID=A0ACD3BD54_9AGAR|nr:MFS general substrate transporter [Pluteus cervinus]